MKKVIIGLSAIFISAFVVIMVVNAQNGRQENKKACTEMSKDCSKCPKASACEKMAEGKTCDPAKCKEMGCDPAKCKEGKCDKATCKTACATATSELKKCGTAETSCCSKK